MPGDVDLGTLDKECAPLELKIQRYVNDLNWYDLYRPLLNYKSTESSEDRMG